MSVSENTIDQVARYLAEIAVNNPRQLPLTLVEAMKQRVILDVVLAVQESRMMFFNQWERALNEVMQGVNSGRRVGLSQSQLTFSHDPLLDS